MGPLIIAILLSLAPRSLSELPATWLVFWNVGQGAWSTLITPERCEHIDMGGTLYPKGVHQLCAGKINHLSLTHFDWDHLNFIAKARRGLGTLCLTTLPEGPLSPRKKLLVSSIPPCPSLPNSGVQRLFKAQFRERNSSHVYKISKALFPGDASLRHERQWLATLPTREIEYLSLGHHGSRTSTGHLLLRKLRNLKGAVASCARKRYGHPHPEVIERLRRHHRPLLITEDFGSIAIALDP